MTTVPGRRSSTFTRLLRHGFTDPSAAEQLLDLDALSSVRSDPVLLEALGATADPDLALRGLVRLAEAEEADERQVLLDTLVTAKPLRDRLLGVLGASEALGDHLARHPRDWQALVTYEAVDLHPGVAEFEHGLADAVDPDSLRVAYRRCLLAIAARDVCGTTDLAETAAELADLATATLRAALAMARTSAPADAAQCRLAVIAMGKCGGHELNYVSDVDVIFVAEPVGGADENGAMQAAVRLAAHLMRICSDTTVEGTIWPVDANLRPEGRNGPLVRTLSSHLAYYQRWAKTWEFQALLKARPVAGDPELGAEYVEAVSPLVWQAADRENFVPDVQKMRRRVVDNIPPTGWSGSSSSVPVDCGTWSSPCSCSSWCTDAATPACTAVRRWRRCGRSPRAGTWAARTPRSSTRRTASCAPWNTASSSTGCAVPTWCPRTRRTCGGSAAPWACARIRWPS